LLEDEETSVYIYIYIYMCVCVCVCVCRINNTHTHAGRVRPCFFLYNLHNRFSSPSGGGCGPFDEIPRSQWRAYTFIHFERRSGEIFLRTKIISCAPTHLPITVMMYREGNEQ
jgi:hypothetical protein